MYRYVHVREERKKVDSFVQPSILSLFVQKATILAVFCTHVLHRPDTRNLFDTYIQWIHKKDQIFIFYTKIFCSDT